MDTSGFFAQIPQRARLPIFHRQLRVLETEWALHTHQVEPLLPSRRLHPLRIAPGYCLLVVALRQCLASDLGPHDELVVGFPCTLDEPSYQFAGTLRQTPSTLMVLHGLGVSTETARQASDELLLTRGFAAEFAFDEDEDGWVSGLASQGGTGLLRMSVRRGPAVPVARWRQPVLSERSGYLLRWDHLIGEHEASVSHHSADARLEWGPHALGRAMAGLTLGPLVACRYSPQCPAIAGPIVESLAC